MLTKYKQVLCLVGHFLTHIGYFTKSGSGGWIRWFESRFIQYGQIFLLTKGR